MLVQSMSRDSWEGNRCGEEILQTPPWRAVAVAIGELDGKSRTLVTLAAANGALMLVGGGDHGLYIVTADFGDGTYHTAVSPSHAAGFVELVVGGQVGEYPLSNCVSLHQALAAAKAFWQSGGPVGTLEWERDG